MNKALTHVAKKIIIASVSTLLALFGSSSVNAESIYKDTAYTESYTTFVDSLVGRLADDIRINHIFFQTSSEQLKRKLFRTLCQNLESNCGAEQAQLEDMELALGLNESELNLVIEHLHDVLANALMPITTKHHLLHQITQISPSHPTAELPLASL